VTSWIIVTTLAAAPSTAHGAINGRPDSKIMASEACMLSLRRVLQIYRLERSIRKVVAGFIAGSVTSRPARQTPSDAPPPEGGSVVTVKPG
jgi:hypothetical protein